MVRLTNSELRALFIQFQQHPDCHSVHLYRGLLGKLSFHWEGSKKNEAAEKQVKEAEMRLKAAEINLKKKKAVVHRK